MQCRSSSGASTSSSLCPICEAPEYCSQLGDMTIYWEKPIWTTEKTEHIEKKNRKLVGYKKVSNENRKNSACNNLGRIQNNVTGLDMEDYYSLCIHRICTAVEETLGSNKVFLKNFQKIACKVSLECKEITFDESSALLFFRKCPEIFKSCGLKGLLLNMLTTCLQSMSEGGNRLVKIPYDLTWQIDLQVWETG